MSVLIQRGGIYLANMNPSKGVEPGKVRPVLVVQTDWLNEVNHSSVVILPLTTQLIDDAEPLRFRLNPREQLLQESDVLCDQIRAIDLKRITSDCLCVIHSQEMEMIENHVSEVLGIWGRKREMH